MTPQNPARPAEPDRTTLIAFSIFVLVGGGASVAIRMTYAELASFWSGAAPFLTAALVLWALVAFRRLPLLRGRALLGALLFGALTVGFATVLIGWGLTATPASRYQVLMAIVPLVTILVASTLAGESITWNSLIGAALVLAGVLVGVLLPARKKPAADAACADSYGQVLPRCA